MTRALWPHLIWMLLTLRYANAQLVRCDMPADVVFLLDASASIEASQWEQEKDFVGILIESLAVERHAINVGLVVFSTEIGQVVDLQPFKSKQQLQALLPTLLQTSQGTDTARAIGRMRQMMQNQARDGAKRIAVVITDGRSENSTATIQEAVYARQMDRVMMIALGVGNETYIDELRAIAKSDYLYDRNRLFTVRDFAQLQGVVEELRNLICEAVPLPPSTTTTPTTTPTTTTAILTAPILPPISCPSPADVVFLLDGSYSIKAADWAVGRVFISALVQSLSVDIDAIHAGIIVYSSGIGDTVPLKPYHDKEVLQRKVSTLRQPPLGYTNTSLGLRALRTMFNQQGRQGVPHIGIVITDGKSSSVQDTIDEARLAKTVDGIVMLVIGVGQDTLDRELRAMATSSATLFNVSDFSALFDIAEALKQIICFVIEESTTPSIPTTTPRAPLIPDLCKECLVEGSIGYNSYPPSCTQYVVCYPESNGGYRAVIKDCPFGLFWSSDAVACVDSAYVNCSADPCKGRPDGWGHTSGTRSCGEYWVCRGGRSLPQCCPQGQRYAAMTGCSNDPGCQDQCSLQSTIAGSGACPFRPNHGDPFSYVQVMPGLPSTVKPCSPGTMYDHDQCACVYSVPSLGCVPSLHYNFNGTFDDRSKYRHTAHIHRVLLSKNGTAYFNGTGRLQVDSLPSNEFKDNFNLHIRYRMQPDAPPKPDLQWNDNYNWGLQEWFTTNQRYNFSFSQDNQTGPGGPEPGVPSGQTVSTLEQIIILKNGTVLYPGSGSATGGGEWPPTGSGTFETRIHLGPMAETPETAVSGGVVYVPNGLGHLLVMYPKTPSAEARWQIVTKDGQAVSSGNGPVPESTAASFKFQLSPPPTRRWYIMTSTGTVLRSGEDAIPDDVKNLYAGFAAGKLLKVDQKRDEVIQWSVSKPDGSDASGGQGPIPAIIRQQLKLDELLKPQGGVVKRWAVLADNGDVLQTGTGDIPPDVWKKYEWLGSGLVMTDTGSGGWSLQRTDGSKLVEGQGPVPSSFSSFIKTSIVIPTYTETSSWSVVLPNGTSLSGQGPIPPHIQKLFEQASAASGTGLPEPVRQSQWFVVDSTGKTVESGYGEAPQELLQSFAGSTDKRVVQSMGVQGSNYTRWEVRGPDGNVLASGEGQPPTDVFKVAQGQQRITLTVPVDAVSGAAGTVLSGANYPGYKFGPAAAGDTSQRGTASAAGGKVTQQWTITLPDGSQRAGFGDIPADVAALMTNSNVRTTRRWSVTLPDGTQRTGEGEVPANIQALIQGTGGQSWVQQNATKTWTVTLPDGSQRSGQGEVPADIQVLVDRFNAANAAAQTDQTLSGQVNTLRRWSVSMPDGSIRNGTGDLPADLQAILDAQQRSSNGQQQQDVQTSNVQWNGQSGSGPTIQRQWSVTMPNGTVRSGSGDIPADLQTLLEVQRAAGTLQTQTRWSVTMPDGTKQSGIGEIPPEVQAMLSKGQDRRWRVRMPDGSIRAGRGALPADLASLRDSSNAAAKGPSRRRRAPAASGERFYELLGNCGETNNPSFYLDSSESQVRLTLKTSDNRKGVTLTLPISPGMNDVHFAYNGNTLTGFSNGVQKSSPLSGSVLQQQAPVVIGDCSKRNTAFRGEIDEVFMSACIS